MEKCAKCGKHCLCSWGNQNAVMRETTLEFAAKLRTKVGCTYRVNSITAGRIRSCFLSLTVLCSLMIWMFFVCRFKGDYSCLCFCRTHEVALFYVFPVVFVVFLRSFLHGIWCFYSKGMYFLPVLSCCSEAFDFEFISFVYFTFLSGLHLCFL